MHSLTPVEETVNALCSYEPQWPLESVFGNRAPKAIWDVRLFFRRLFMSDAEINDDIQRLSTQSHNRVIEQARWEEYIDAHGGVAATHAKAVNHSLPCLLPTKTLTSILTFNTLLFDRNQKR